MFPALLRQWLIEAPIPSIFFLLYFPLLRQNPHLTDFCPSLCVQRYRHWHLLSKDYVLLPTVSERKAKEKCITESQNCIGHKEPKEIIKSNSPAEAGTLQ